MLTIYKASAGSGKTFTLTYEYIKTLLGLKIQPAGNYVLNSNRYAPGRHRLANRHRGILAITFTNAATEEMKSRIVRELAALAGDDTPRPATYASRLTSEYGCTRAELRDAAAEALAEMLYDYGNFNVSTIDSFFQTVLRTFSREVDHQGDYELSLDRGNVLRQSISLMLDELNYSPGPQTERLYRWIKALTMERLADGKGYNFFHRDGDILRRLVKSMDRAMDEQYSGMAPDIEEYLADPTRVERFGRELRRRIDSADMPARQAAQAVIAWLDTASLPPDILNRTIRARVEMMLDPKASCAAEKSQIILGCAAGDKAIDDMVAKTACKKLKVNPADLGGLDSAIMDFCTAYVAAASLRRIDELLLESLGQLDFIGMAQTKLSEYLRENNLVLISDTGDLLRRIISDAEMPFIYERLGMKLTNLLIDEFQDTSHLQWHNLKHLVGNSLAGGHDNLIIGDEKQSIYRFRNSDSELLGHVVQERDFPRDHRLKGIDQADNTNYRSAGALVDFNNRIFARLADDLGVPGYGNVRQGIHHRDLPAYINMKFYGADEMPDPDTILEEMCREILRQHEAGYRWSDIIILAREGASAIAAADYLIKNHPEVRVLSSEALLLNSSAAVRTIMSMLKLVEHSYHGRTAADEAANAPRFGSRNDVAMMITRFNYFMAEGMDAREALELSLDSGTEAPAATALDARIMDIRAENPANLVALIEAVIAHKISPAQRAAEYAYIAALQDMAMKYSDSADSSLASFTAAYDANIGSWAIKASSDLDAVRVMTIHKSKGLEAPCVHIPFGDWSLEADKLSLWLPVKERLQGFDPDILPPLLRVNTRGRTPLADPQYSPFADIYERAAAAEINDNLNIAYVAFTRASRELMVWSATKRIGERIRGAIATEIGSFTIGEPTVPEERRADSRTVIDAGSYPVVFRSDARELTSIDDALAVHLDIGGEVDSEIVDEVPAFGGTPEMIEAARRGTLMHSVLASTMTMADLPAALEKAFARAGCEEDERREISREFDEAFAAGGSTVSAWFEASAGRVLAERTIYVSDGDESFRPDRVILPPDGSAVVVDYKFTTAPRHSHRYQVAHYMNLLGAMGYSPVAGYIWYPLLKKIVRV